MKLKESINAATLPRGGTCTVVALMAALSPQDAAELNECFDDPSYSHAQISRGLKAEGHLLSYNIVQRHRKGDCGCPPRVTVALDAEPTNVAS